MRKNQRVKLSITVSSPTSIPRGKVRIYENGHLVKSLTLSSGKVSSWLKMGTRGLRSLKVTYAGSATVAGHQDTNLDKAPVNAVVSALDASI